MGGKISTLPSDRVSSKFPLVPLGCEKASSSLFDCLEKKAPEYLSARLNGEEGEQIGACSKEISAYNNCVETNIGKSKNKKFNRVQERVPEEYRFSKQ